MRPSAPTATDLAHWRQDTVGASGGPRNGVLTAVEDFLGETERDLTLFVVPGNKGLAIIVGREHLRRRRLTKVLRAVHDPQAGAELSPGYASTVLHGRQR